MPRAVSCDDEASGHAAPCRWNDIRMWGPRRILISRIKIIVRLNTKPDWEKQCVSNRKFELGHKKAPRRVLF
ncbi:hypothetical protein Dda3937_04482 [Dickeya dadantii 3937]|uniref:Uncharacterized protein n=1 Tax=Dickeya dadantii (strain 3937) TaxID=198628 RepID=E0SB49_DICD3|nr:hypothetical protein Dda3937_04482 [Dickeya dadantii 3937]